MAFEKEIIVLLQQLKNPVFNWISIVVSYFFDYPLAIALAVIFLICKKYKNAIKFLILEGVGLAVQLILKAIVKRPRPYVTYSEIENIYPASNTSFPSGHTLTCIIAVVYLYSLVNSSNMSKNKKILCKVGLGVMIITCVLNRMYLGQHYITDCIASILIGLIIGITLLPPLNKLLRGNEKEVTV